MAISGNEIIPEKDPVLHELSSFLSMVLRSDSCQTTLQNRYPLWFQRGKAICDIGDKERGFFFIRAGVVKIESISDDSDEVISNVRKSGEVCGELSEVGLTHAERAVALEFTEVVRVSYADVLENIRNNQALQKELIGLFGNCLLCGQEQVTSLAFRRPVDRLRKALADLARELELPIGNRIEITAHLNAEELARMMAARRERMSLGMAIFCRQGVVESNLTLGPFVITARRDGCPLSSSAIP